MNADNWQRVKELCLAALERAPHEREGYLREECHEDLSLFTEVDSLPSRFTAKTP